MAVNYSILVDAELNTSNIQQQLDTLSKSMQTDDSFKLSFQEANLIMSKSIDIIADMIGEVYSLDSALTEFKKVSDLSGESLDNYVMKLSEMGTAVARTGKPKCQAPNVRIVN